MSEQESSHPPSRSRSAALVVAALVVLIIGAVGLYLGLADRSETTLAERWDRVEGGIKACIEKHDARLNQRFLQRAQERKGFAEYRKEHDRKRWFTHRKKEVGESYDFRSSHDVGRSVVRVGVDPDSDFMKKDRPSFSLRLVEVRISIRRTSSIDLEPAFEIHVGPGSSNAPLVDDLEALLGEAKMPYLVIEGR